MGAAIVGTVSKITPLANKRLLILTSALSSADDDITLTLATHGVRTIYGAWAVLEAGEDAQLMAGLVVSFSGLVISIQSQVAAGTGSTNWTGANIRVFAIVD